MVEPPQLGKSCTQHDYKVDLVCHKSFFLFNAWFTSIMSNLPAGKTFYIHQKIPHPIKVWCVIVGLPLLPSTNGRMGPFDPRWTPHCKQSRSSHRRSNGAPNLRRRLRRRRFAPPQKEKNGAKKMRNESNDLIDNIYWPDRGLGLLEVKIGLNKSFLPPAKMHVRCWMVEILSMWWAWGIYPTSKTRLNKIYKTWPADLDRYDICRHHCCLPCWLTPVNCLPHCRGTKKNVGSKPSWDAGCLTVEAAYSWGFCQDGFPEKGWSFSSSDKDTYI